MTNDKWNEICYYLSENIKNDISESVFEQNVIHALRVLGWTQYSGDFDIRPSFQIGASNRITPDFVVKSSDKTKLFVIEIKQPNISLTSTFQQQLFSYMRQLKLEYGILIGQGIQVFYDGVLVQQEDPVLLETIRFEKNNEKGDNFVRLFTKESFEKELLKEFTLNALKKINRKEECKKLKKEILSDNYKNKILELIRQDFLNEYDGEIIDSVITELLIKIIDKNTSIVNSSSQIIRQYSKPTELNHNSSEKDKFKNWLVKNGYSEATSNSYSSAINKLSKHISNIRKENINIYFISDLLFFKKLVELYSLNGNHSSFGSEGNGTLRNAIKKLYEFKKQFYPA